MITTKRLFYIMIGLVVGLSLVVIAVAVAGNNLLKKEAFKLSELKAQNQVVQDQEIALIQGKKDIEKYKDLNELAKSIVPQDKDQARTVREINRIAAESGIQLQGITFTASTLGQAAPAPAKPAEDSSGGSGGSGGGTDAAPKPAQPAQPSVTQVTPVEGIQGVYALGITITPAADQPIPYEQFLSFLEKLENNRRTAHVDNISVNPVEGSDGVTFTLTLNAYVKP